MNQVAEWISLHEDRLKLASLVVAGLILLVSIYRWLLLKWRADVSIRKYAYLHPLEDEKLRHKQELRIEVPESQHILIELVDAQGNKHTLYDGQAAMGDLLVHLSMESLAVGDYEVIMRTDDQTALRRYSWSG